MTPVLTRFLLAALACISILLARAALRHHERALATSNQETRTAQAPQRWVGTARVVLPRAGRRSYLPATFYQVRWLGRARPAAGPQ